jgi:hypothetical protein
MNEYSPNFNDPRVQTRIKQALGFARAVMSETKPHAWSTRYIDKFFGSQRNDLSKYLRKHLLICTDEFYRYNSNENKCKEYLLNKTGFEFLSEALKINNIQLYPSVVEVAHLDHLGELTTGNFEYNDKSGRLWHPLQRYRKQYRTQILADSGYLYDYDIECCAPTLIHQYAQKLGMDLYLFALQRYLKERTQVRQELAEKLELDVDAIKEIINALFCGARVANNKDSDIYQILNGDHARIEYLKQDPYITELRNDIKICWEYITPSMMRRRKTKTNRLIPITCREKWNVYFELERSVLNEIRSYLIDKNYRYFLMHDGWSCDKEIDENELRDFVRNQTGFDLKFEHTKNNNIQLYPSVVEVAE